uniref:Uncharacterized protein n=1 Tax=Rhizophora mucronata TaxID=61149 RepID=A0A2P2J0A5_RHIMU
MPNICDRNQHPQQSNFDHC